MVARVPSEQRRRELVSVALRQYTTLGLAATTRSSLAAELGVDRVIVHRLYPDLDDLFVDVIGHVRSVGDAEITAVVEAVDELSSPAALWEMLLARVVRAARAHPLEWRFLFLTLSDPEAAAQLTALRAEVTARVIGELVARADEPENDEERRELAWGATFLYQGLFGSIARQLTHGDPADDERFVQYLASIVEDVVDLPAWLAARDTT